MSRRVQVRIGEVILEGVREADLPIVMARLEADLLAALPSGTVPGSVVIEALPEVTVPAGSGPEAVGSAVAAALVPLLGGAP